MIRGKYSAVIGQKKAHSLDIDWATYKQTRFRPITAPHFPLIIKPRNFAKRQCKLQWLTPPIKPSLLSYILVDTWAYLALDPRPQTPT